MLPGAAAEHRDADNRDEGAETDEERATIRPHRDGVVAVTSDISGELRAQLTANFVSVLYARSNCTDRASDLACVTDTTATKLRELVQPISAGVPLYLFIDGISGQSGVGKLTLTVATVAP